MGKFTSYIDLELFGVYKVPLKLIGTALSVGDKKVFLFPPLHHLTFYKTNKKGIESLPEDFDVEKKFALDETNEPGTRKIKRGDRIIFTTMETSENVNMPQLEGTGQSGKLDMYYANKNNKTKYNNFLKEQRQKR